MSKRTVKKSTKKPVKKTSTKIEKQKKGPSKRFVKNQALAVVIFGVAILLFCLILIPGENIWRYFHNLLPGLFGKCAIIWPILLTYVAIMETIGIDNKSLKLKIWLSSFIIWICCSLFYVFSLSVGHPKMNIFVYIYDQCVRGLLDKGSGLFGAILGEPLVWAFGITASRITLIILLFVFVMFLTGTTLLQFFKLLTHPVKMVREKINDENLKLNENETDINIDDEEDITSRVLMGNERNKGIERLKKEYEVPETSKNVIQNKNLNISSKEAEEIARVTEEFISRTKKESGKAAARAEEIKAEEQRFAKKLAEKEKAQKEYIYNYPPLDLLNKSVKAKEDDITEELQNNGQMLVDTLKSFNVQTKIVDISRGPAVTRYEIQPASGVKISKITTLSDDIALNLASAGVRIEAPIPGKAAVGVEIPNKVVSIVNMNELISSQTFLSSESRLTVVLGRDISGQVMVADLAKMPHLLIAGSTGSGKSVCVNSFIISILYNASPDEVKLLMIDPKVVELGVYNGVPHLLVPVVTDPRKAAGALNWAVNEMLKRYKQFAENNVRDLGSYNKLVEQNPELKDAEGEKLKKMAQIVIIIDELSDLMMAAPNEVEDYICRLAQMARAAGMHLVIATQRPSVDVITGIIKANIPSRIALAVSSQIDSRTILDMSGAEKLLGRGDMLFAPVGAQKPIRVQGCYVTDKEIEKITNFVKNSDGSATYDQTIVDEIEKNAVGNKNKESEHSGDNLWDDELIEEAVKLVIEAGQASTSMLQRRLRVGYARAGKLIDQMEQMGVVGPHEGSKPRQVMMNYDSFLEMKATRR